MSRPLRVIKLGGSLLNEARLADLARAWIAHQPDSANVLIVGGGLWADGVREAYHRFSFDEVFCHWLCVDLLAHTSALAAQLLQSPLLDDWRALGERDWDNGETARSVVFHAGPFLRAIEPSLAGERLAHNWSVTSDSIAARVAQLLPADELVLWKSAAPPSATDDLDAWVKADYVDPSFPRAAKGLTVRAVDLTAVAARDEA